MPQSHFNMNLGAANAPNAAARGVGSRIADTVEGAANAVISSRKSRQDALDRDYQRQRDHWKDQLQYAEHGRMMKLLDQKVRTERHRGTHEKQKAKGQKAKNVGIAAESSAKSAAASDAWNEANARAGHHQGIADAWADSEKRTYGANASVVEQKAAQAKAKTRGEQSDVQARVSKNEAEMANHGRLADSNAQAVIDQNDIGTDMAARLADKKVANTHNPPSTREKRPTPLLGAVNADDSPKFIPASQEPISEYDVDSVGDNK